MRGRVTSVNRLITTTAAGTSTRRKAGAITWIDPGRAFVARRERDGSVRTMDFPLPADEDARNEALADVVTAIGEPDLVLLLGDPDLRTLLEREYVAIYRRPDRLMDVDVDGPLSDEELAGRLRDPLS
jgi:hypothetical protein